MSVEEVFNRAMNARVWQGTDPKLPYPWCRDPEGCKNRGSCPRDPSCGG